MAEDPEPKRGLRKRVVPAVSAGAPLKAQQWLDLEGCAEIEVTSESAGHPIEAALLPGNGRGWRADGPGRQSVRVIFDAPQTVTRMQLVFVEEEISRTQEFVLRWGSSRDQEMREIVRQQYNFTPVSSEVEDYRMNLCNVAMVELEIVPALGREDVVASLAEWRIG